MFTCAITVTSSNKPQLCHCVTLLISSSVCLGLGQDQGHPGGRAEGQGQGPMKGHHVGTVVETAGRIIIAINHFVLVYI